MSKKDIFGDDLDPKASLKNADTLNFAQMFEAAEAPSSRRLRNGDQLRGEILTIGKEEAFVTTGTPVDGVILIKELLDENKVLKYKVGDIIDVVVTSTRDNEIRLSRRGAGSSSADSLEDAFDMELPIEGRVSEVCNGGFRINIQGKTAFCPISQIDSKFVEKGEDYVGKKFEFLITQFDSKGRNIVVSRRKVLDMQKAENEGAFMQKHQPGDLFTGTITRLEKFGAFVEVESGVEGLIHISELGWSRVNDPSEIVRIGQSVQVKLLKIEELNGKLKISLSLKQAGGEGDPWMSVFEKFPVGSVHKGRIEKKEVYGLFVNIGPGITGLLPKSKWRDSVDAAGIDNKKKGDEVLVQVDQILFEEKKISLGIPQEAEDLSWKSHSSSTTSSGLGTLGDQFKNLLKKS